MDKKKDLGMAAIEYIDPFREPDEYGVDVLLSQIGDLGKPGPDVQSKWKKTVADYGRDAVTAAGLRELGSELRRHPPYRVLEEGSDNVTVPFLFASAPDVADVEVTVSLTQALEASGEISFLVAGNGPTANAKITVGAERVMRASSSEALTACFILPVQWERRASIDNEDHNWLIAWPSSGRTETEIELRKGLIANALRRRTETVSTVGGGTRPFESTGSETVEAGLGFSVGFKVTGLDVSFTVSTTATVSAELSASLPSGHRYIITYYGGPPGVVVNLES